MHRTSVIQRPDLQETALEHGFEYRAGEGIPYWDETAYYRFTLRQIEEDIELPAAEIEAMCFQLLDHSLTDETFYRRLCIPEAYWDYVGDSWRNRDKDLYGRLDFSYDGAGKAKLLEYNADTPTTLYESAIFQWVWLEQAIAAGLIPRDCDQFAELQAAGFGSFPVCIAKTQYSFSTDPNLKGAPSNHVVPIREVRLATGAEFLVVVCGDIMTMPGLPREPAAVKISVDEQGRIEGLF